MLMYVDCETSHEPKEVITMQNFVNTFVKVFTNVAELPHLVLRPERAIKTKTLKIDNYGGFTYSDWKKVGNDMKRGLISFGQSR